MRYFLDTEFIERPCTIDLISLGIVSEDGREFYAVSNEVDWTRANPWVIDNVLPHLTPTEDSIGTRAQIADRVLAFVDKVNDEPEFWGYYSDYDWVVFCWLFGTLVELPEGWPMFCRDLKQWCVDLGNPKLPPQTSTEHNALDDARWNREVFAFLAAHPAPKEGPA